MQIQLSNPARRPGVRETVRRAARADQRGFALLSVTMLMLLALTLGAAAMLYTVLDLKSTQHYNTGNQAFASTEAGIVYVMNVINDRGVVNVQNEVVNSGLIWTTPTPTPSSLSGYPNATYQVTSVVSGPTPATDAIVTMTGRAALSAKRVIQVGIKRGKLSAGPGALHLSADTAFGTFNGNSMVIDGNNWNLQDITTNPPIAVLDPSIAARPAISTRNDTVNAQVTTSLSGLGTIIGMGTPPSVWTTAAASTADLQRFVNDILAANSGGGVCPTSGPKDSWLPGPCNTPPGPGCGIHCVKLTNGNATHGQDFWGTYTPTSQVPNITYVYDNSAKIAGGSYGAGVLIFTGDADFQGSFSFCGWVLFLNPSSNGLKVGGNPTIYGEVLSPLPAFDSGGSISIKYSQNCLIAADSAGINTNGNLPHPVVISSWSEQ
jgi:hypothetical protein